MRLTVVPGKNCKNYLYLHDINTSKDYDILADINKVVSRKEFKIYSKSFDKTVSESYMIDDQLVPAQFIQDIYQKVLPHYPELKIEKLNTLYDTKLTREIFDEWLTNINLPKGFDLTDPKYIYQPESVYKLLYFKNGRIKVGTGGGKTLVCYLYMKYMLDNILRQRDETQAKKILLLVNRTDLVTQTVKEFEKFDSLNAINDNDYSIPLRIKSIYSGAKAVMNANVVIGTWQSLKDYEPEFFDDFAVFMCDEAHTSKAYHIRKSIYDKMKFAEYCAGFTATYPDYKTIDYLNIVALFGTLVHVKTTAELIKDGNITPVKIHQIKLKYSEVESELSKNLKASGIIGTEKYNAEKHWFHTHNGRNKVVISLLKKLEYNHLILTNTVEYIQILKDEIEANCPDKTVLVIHGKISRKERERQKALMHDNDNLVLLATSETMSTGVSINNIHYVHFVDGGCSYIRVNQSVGRGVRLHAKKKFLNVFDYWDLIPQSSFNNHGKTREKIYTEEKHPIINHIVEVDERLDMVV